MEVRVVMMRKAGVAVERRMLSDRYTVKYSGCLVMMDVTDQRATAYRGVRAAYEAW